MNGRKKKKKKKKKEGGRGVRFLRLFKRKAGTGRGKHGAAGPKGRENSPTVPDFVPDLLGAKKLHAGRVFPDESGFSVAHGWK